MCFLVVKGLKGILILLNLVLQRYIEYNYECKYDYNYFIKFCFGEIEI